MGGRVVVLLAVAFACDSVGCAAARGGVHRIAVPRALSVSARARARASSVGEAPEAPRTPAFLRPANVLPLAAAAFYAAQPATLDDAVAACWRAIYACDFVHSPMFEAQVASTSFVVWIVFFSSLHLVLGKRAAQHRFDGAMPHDPFSWARPSNWFEAINPLFSYLGSIQLYHMLHSKAPLVEAAPSFGVLCAEVALGLVLYDLCFWPLHLLMHRGPFRQLRSAHGYHHRKGHTLNALETVQHSYADGLLQVVVNICVQQLTPFGPVGCKHPLSRLVHNVVVTYLLCEAHSGYTDLPFMSHRLWPAVFGGAPRHERHHHDGKVAFQQFFTYLDDLFGFGPVDEGAHAAPSPTTTPSDRLEARTGDALGLAPTSTIGEHATGADADARPRAGARTSQNA